MKPGKNGEDKDYLLLKDQMFYLRSERITPTNQNPIEKNTETSGRRYWDNVATEKGVSFFAKLMVGEILRFLRCWLRACMATSAKGTIMAKIIQMSSILMYEVTGKV